MEDRGLLSALLNRTTASAWDAYSTHLLIVCTDGANLTDKSSGLWPARTISTIRRRYPAEYRGRDFGMKNTTSSDVPK
jgi:hypothetical protein